MESDIPKVLHPLCEKPLILYVIESLEKAGVDRIVTVVGYKGEMVIDAVQSRSETVWQHEQLGTGHAVMQAEEALSDFSGMVIVACGDVPLIRPSTFRRLIEYSAVPDVKAVVLTMMPENPTGYGRIVKEGGDFIKIVEEKDASPEIKEIREVNSGTYIFDKDYLFEGLKKIDTNNAQREYYLPDVLKHIIDSGYKVKTAMLEDPIEGSGINRKEELKNLEQYLADIK